MSERHKIVVCPRCHGEGEITVGNGEFPLYETCKRCYGSGKIIVVESK